MKILYLTTSLSRDHGWGRNADEVLRRLPATGITPLVGVKGSAARFNLPGVVVVGGLRSDTDRFWKQLLVEMDYARLRALAASARAVHCLTEPLMPLAAMLARRHRLPLFHTCVGTYSITAAKGPRRRLYLQAYHDAAGLVGISRYTVKRTLEIVPAVAPRIRAVPLGVDSFLGDENPAPAHTREMAFITVGQVKPRKGLDQIVEALPQVIASHPEVRLYVAGSLSQTDFVSKVRQRAEVLGVANSIVWLGQVEELVLQDYYRRVRGVVLPSQNVGDHFEGFGLIHLEANTFGVPAIGSFDCGNEDAIIPGRSGFLVSQGDIAALAERMISLLGPTVEWDRLSRSARQFAREMSWERTVEGYLAVYQTAGINVDLS